MTQPTEMMMRAYAAELVIQLQSAQEMAKSCSGFDLGKKMGLYEALSILVNRTSSFGIPPAYLGIDDVNPDKFI
jgi:hypothetical protein